MKSLYYIYCWYYIYGFDYIYGWYRCRNLQRAFLRPPSWNLPWGKDALWLAHFNKIVLQVAIDVLHTATCLATLRKVEDISTFLAISCKNGVLHWAIFRCRKSWWVNKKIRTKHFLSCNLFIIYMTGIKMSFNKSVLFFLKTNISNIHAETA